MKNLNLVLKIQKIFLAIILSLFIESCQNKGGSAIESVSGPLDKDATVQKDAIQIPPKNLGDSPFKD